MTTEPGRHANPDGERARYDWQPWAAPIAVVAVALAIAATFAAAAIVDAEWAQMLADADEFIAGLHKETT